MRCGFDAFELYRTEDPHLLIYAETVRDETARMIEAAHKS